MCAARDLSENAVHGWNLARVKFYFSEQTLPVSDCQYRLFLYINSLFFIPSLSLSFLCPFYPCLLASVGLAACAKATYSCARHYSANAFVCDEFVSNSEATLH
jgi:hypothetical protein